jgi:hypothetical protein
MQDVVRLARLFKTTPDHVAKTLEGQKIRTNIQEYKRARYAPMSVQKGTPTVIPPATHKPCMDDRNLFILNILKEYCVQHSLTWRGCNGYWMECLVEIQTRGGCLPIPIYSIYEVLVKTNSITFKMPASDISGHKWFIFNTYPWGRVFVCSQKELRDNLKRANQTMYTQNFKLGKMKDSGKTLQERLPELLANWD